MAIGDDALADGMDLVSGTEPANTLDTEDNKTRDYIVQRIRTTRQWVTDTLAALWPLSIARGGTGADDVLEARANLGVWGNSGATAPGTSPSLGWNGTRIQYEIPGFAFPTELARMVDIPSSSGAYDGFLNPAIYNRALSGWRSVGIQADGTLGNTSSARRFKENIVALDITDEQIAALQLVEFDWIADGSHDVGLIADDVAEVLPWAVFHDENDLVLGIHYERLALALLPTVQRLIERLDALEARDGSN